MEIFDKLLVKLPAPLKPRRLWTLVEERRQEVKVHARMVEVCAATLQAATLQGDEGAAQVAYGMGEKLRCDSPQKMGALAAVEEAVAIEPPSAGRPRNTSNPAASKSAGRRLFAAIHSLDMAQEHFRKWRAAAETES